MARFGALALVLPLTFTSLACPTKPIPGWMGSAGTDGGIAGQTGAAGVSGHGGSGGVDSTGGAGANAGAGGSATGGGASGQGGCSGACPGPTSGDETGTGVCVDNVCAIACSANYPTRCAAQNSCVDVTADGKNCGTCGHDCLGGSCIAGQCQPLELAQYTGDLQRIYLGAQYVYTTTDLGYIGRANKDGSDLKPFAMPGFASSTLIGTQVAEDGDRVFFVWYGSNFQLAYCLVSGCDASVTPVGGPYTQFFAVDQIDHKIFWVDYSPTAIWASSSIGTITGTSIPGGTLASGSNGSPLFYTQGGIFFIDGTALKRISISGGAFTTPAIASSTLAILGANDNNLYLFDGTSIVSTPLPNGTGGAPTKLIDASLSGGFAADDNSIYWIDSGVQTCQIENCAATKRALPTRTVDDAEDVGIDSQAIYWGAVSSDPSNSTGKSGSTVWKLAK